MARSKVGRFKGASAISDRSGFRFPMSEMVEEPGTGWLVHYTESDGQWSLNEHPLNNLGRYLKDKQGDPFPVKNARPRPTTETVSAIRVHQGSGLLASQFVAQLIPSAIRTASATITGVASVTLDALDAVLFPSTSVSGVGSATLTALDVTFMPATSVTGVGTLTGSGTVVITMPSTSVSGVATVTMTAQDVNFFPSTSVSGVGSVDCNGVGNYILETTSVTGIATANLLLPDWLAADWLAADWDTGE